MVKAIYTKAVYEKGRRACVGGDEMSYEYKDIPSEAEFQKVKQEIIDELNDKNTHLVKVSFYTETKVPFEISYDDINPDDEYNRVDEVNEITLAQILDDKDSMPRWMWEMLNCREPAENLPEDEDALTEYFKKHGVLK